MQNKIISFLSQWRIIIPLGVVVLGWFFWPQLNAMKVKKLSVVQTTPSTIAQTKQEVDVISLFGAKKKLSCAIESATAVIDDKKIAATLILKNKQTKVVFDGDCLYRWASGSSSGERSCGLKSYLPLISQFVSNDSLQKLFPQTNELVSACKEISVVESKTFEIPKNVLFKNKKLF